MIISSYSLHNNNSPWVIFVSVTCPRQFKSHIYPNFETCDLSPRFNYLLRLQSFLPEKIVKHSLRSFHNLFTMESLGYQQWLSVTKANWGILQGVKFSVLLPLLTAKVDILKSEMTLIYYLFILFPLYVSEVLISSPAASGRFKYIWIS